MPIASSGPVLVLSSTECRMLWQAANLDDLRVRSRSSEKLYALLLSVYKTGLTSGLGQVNPDQADIPHTESTAMTLEVIARRVGVTPRTVRRDIAAGRLHAEKRGGVWIATTDAADTYIESRKRTS